MVSLKNPVWMTLVFMVGMSPLLAQEAGTQKTYEFVYKFKPGELVRWNVVHDVQFDTTVSENTQKARTNSVSTKLWRVEGVSPNGDVTFSHIIEDVTMWHELTGRARVTYNSKADKDNVPKGFENVAATLNIPLYEVKINKHGSVIKRIVKIKKDDKNEGSDRQITIPFPKEAIPVGHKWDLPYDFDLKLESGVVKNIKARERFHFESLSGNVALINMETQILSPVRDPAIESQIIQRTGKGKLYFDLELGRVIKQRFDINKTVHNFRGPGSVIHYDSKFREDLKVINKDDIVSGPQEKPAAAEKVAAEPKPEATKK